MKYLFIGVFTLLCLFACQSNDSKYIIKGTLPTAQQDGEWIYLAPMENASIENIDSTRIENARFTFQGTGEEMKVLRMRILLRLKFQELLVVTEPGVTSVRIDSISSASVHRKTTPCSIGKTGSKRPMANPMPYGQRLRPARREIPSASSRHGIP